MEKKVRTRNKTVAIITLIVAIIAIFYIIKYFKESNNPVLFPNADQKTEIIKLRDSLTLLKQVVLISENRNLTKDSLLMEAIRLGRIKTETVMQWRSETNTPGRTLEMQDSFNHRINDILKIQKDNILLANTPVEKNASSLKLEREKKNLLDLRIPFKDSSKYRVLEGTIGLNSKIIINKDIIISEPYVIFGEQRGFLKRPVITVLVGDKNPATTQKDLYSATYKPKQKAQISVGPMILTNGRQFIAGPGVSYKKGIFSVSVGYTVINTK